MRSFELNESTKENPWPSTLAAVMFAVRTTAHTAPQATPAQLVFGHDTVVNTPFEANWEPIKRRRQEQIKHDNQRENAKRAPHEHNTGDQVLVLADALDKFSTAPCEGPCKVLKVNNNGALQLQMGAVTDAVNVRRTHPRHT